MQCIQNKLVYCTLGWNVATSKISGMVRQYLSRTYLAAEGIFSFLSSATTCHCVCHWWGRGGNLYRYLYGETGKNHANFGPTIHPCRLGQYVSMFQPINGFKRRLLFGGNTIAFRTIRRKPKEAKFFKSVTDKAQLSIPISTKRQYYEKVLLAYVMSRRNSKARQKHRKKMLILDGCI